MPSATTTSAPHKHIRPDLIPSRVLKSPDKSLRHPTVLAEAERRAGSIQLRVADAITSFAGSMRFVYVHIVVFALWMVFFEHSPWPTLTLVVSLEALIPVYVFYSMFGFQRTGDALWAAGDQMARGFVIGATAGRTTLTGEGTQHADGHSLLLASTNPAVVSYDPAYGYEIGHIVRAGIERMYGGSHPNPNVMYYITVYNEPIAQPVEPEGLDVEGVLNGIYLLKSAPIQGPKVQLLASGVAVPWALEAQQLLASDWGVAADVWSVTSWNELRRDGVAVQEHNFLHPDEQPAVPYVTQKLAGAEGPFVAVTDFMHAVPDQIRPFVPGDFATLGADDFGFADTRAAARRFFKIDGPSLVVRALESLVAQGKLDRSVPQRAIDQYRLMDVTAGTTGSTGGES